MDHASAFKVAERQSKLISRGRLITFILTVYLLILLRDQSLPWMILIGLGGAILFFYLIRLSDKIEKLLIHQQAMLALYTEEIKILDGKYMQRNSGESFSHRLIENNNDLDLFGTGSLFQYINRTISEQGQLEMANSLTHFNRTDEIKKRQEAIQELSILPDWMQYLRSQQYQSPITQRSQDKLNTWIQNPELQHLSSAWHLLRYLLPTVSGLIILAFSTGYLSTGQLTLCILVILAIQVLVGRVVGRWFLSISTIASELQALNPSLKLIEQKKFQSPLLHELHQDLLRDGKPASEHIHTLSGIIKRFEYRMNPVVFIPLNFLCWWDLQQLLALHHWRSSFNGQINNWYNTLAQMESFISYGILSFNHPRWVYPTLSDEWFTLTATSMSHPLIQESKAISNDYVMSGSYRMSLITGSNMAGKSTFLRTLGANMVLTHAGAPVCAAQFIHSPGPILTSMRISDNLQEETSTFYAELKKIKRMVDAVNQHAPVILLIDEMLRGTNAEDRKLGAHGFTKQLIEEQAVAIIASHDTGLYRLMEQYPLAIKAYYFDSYIADDQLKFDYKLKSGTTASTNASYLMKKIGIRLDLPTQE